MAPPDDIILACEGIHHGFGSRPVLHDINLRIRRGQILALVGPSGCGKSTLLRAILGTHPPQRGRVLLFDRPGDPGYAVRRPGRDRGIVYQRYSLYPFLTAQQNVALGLMFDENSLPGRLLYTLGWRGERRRHLRQAAELLEQVGLGEAIGHYPHELSGGMRQRVAVAQALIMRPRLLLMDEPFGALDAATREELQRMLLKLYVENTQARAQGRPPAHTILLVTHELDEAIYVGDRVVGLSQYWNWKEQGFARCPGAAIVYDDAAPVFEPDAEQNFEQFAEQRAQIRQVVFDPAANLARETFQRYWKREVRGGERQFV
jgi:NitT/TauT family transport system ATP-binding protein